MYSRIRRLAALSAALALIVSAVGLGQATQTLAAHVSNPWQGAFGAGAVDPIWQAQVDAFAQSVKAENPKMSAAASLVKTMPTGIWLDSKAAVNGTGAGTGLTAILDAAVTQQTTNNTSNLPLVVNVVVYDIPGRDCSASASNGEEVLTLAYNADDATSPINNPAIKTANDVVLADYETKYIDIIANKLSDSKYSNLRFALFIEPDGLGNSVTNTVVNTWGTTPVIAAKCKTAQTYYEQGIAYALKKFHANSNAYTFMDATNSAWLSWHPAEAATEFKTVALAAGGYATVDGFVTNVSNYAPYYEQLLYGPTKFTHSDIAGVAPYYNQPDLDEYSFQTDMRTNLIAAGFPSTIGFVTDSSRNGWGGRERPVTTSASTDLKTYVNLSRVDKRTVTSDWCNPSGAGLGEAPSAYPYNNQMVDGIHPPNWAWAFVWVKPPGQSDGSSDTGSGETGYDKMCDPTQTNVSHDEQLTGAMPHTPHAGTFNNAQFAQLLDHAVPQFNPGTQGALTSTAPSPANQSCNATYVQNNAWNDGLSGSTWDAFSGTVTVTNTGATPTAAWQVTLTWANNEVVSSASGASLTQTRSVIQSAAKTLTASNLNTNAVIAVGATTTFSVIGSSYGSLVAPTLTCTSKAGGKPTAPQPPTIVSVTPGNGSVLVKWAAPSSDGGSSITGYKLTSSDGKTCTTTGYTTLACQISGLTNGTSYTFTVQAINAFGTSAASGPSNPVTPATVPVAPTGAAATAGAGQATITWTDPTDNGGSAITGYTVSSTPWSMGCTVSGATATGCVVNGLNGGTSYTFTVYAINAIGTSAGSTPSNAVTPTTPTIPGTPTNVVALGTGGTAIITWAVPTTGGSPASYTVTSNMGQTCTAVGARTCTITGLPYGIYFFTVKATNSAGTGPASAQSNGLIYADPPTPPLNATATGGAGQATVSWTTPDSYNGLSITSYTVTASSGGQTCVATAPTLTCTVTGLTGGTSYTFTVTATNGAGTSAASNVTNAVTPTAPIATPAPTGTPAPTPTCTASVSTQSTWMSGSNGYAQMMVNVTNSGTVAINSWKVTVTWPKTMTIPYGFSNGTVTGSGTTSFVVTNVSYNGAIAVGASVPSTSGNDQRPNFQVYGSGAYTAPTSVTCSAT